MFDAVTSYESSAMARAGDVFLVDSATTLTDGFFMVSVQCGAVEARFLKLASSKDLQVNPGLVVLDLDVPSAQRPPCLARHGSFSARSGFPTKTAVGPGCIPWDSSLCPVLYPGLPVCKIHRPKSVLLSSHPQVAPLWTCRSIMNVLGPHAALFWHLPVQERNRAARALLPCFGASQPSAASRLQRLSLDCSHRALPGSCVFPCVPGWLFCPMENGAASHCWWISHADLTKQNPAHAIQEVLKANVSADVVGPVTSTQHIQIAVSALHRWYPQGLLILHKPARSCLLFLPGHDAQQFSLVEAGQWLDACPQTLAMLYTQKHAHKLGQYVACKLHRANPSCLHSGISPKVEAGLRGSGIFTDPVTPVPESSCPTMSSSSLPLSQSGVATGLGVRAEGGLDVDSPAWTGENERPCENPRCRICFGSRFPLRRASCSAAMSTAAFTLPSKVLPQSLPASHVSPAFASFNVPACVPTVSPTWPFDVEEATVSRSESVSSPAMGEPIFSGPLEQCVHRQASATWTSLPFFPKWLPKTMQHRHEVASNSLPFFPKWRPATENLPEAHGGMIGDTPPPVHASSSTYWNLLVVGVPAPIAREAARRFCDDFDAALDWACASDRRHTRVEPGYIDLVHSASEDGSPCPGVPVASPDALPAPALSLADVHVPALASGVGAPALPLVPRPPASWTMHTPSFAASAELGRLHSPHGAASSHAAASDKAEETLTSGDQDTLPGRMGMACYVDDPSGEVHAWFSILANSKGDAGLDSGFWGRMPLYSQYIAEHSLCEILVESLKSIQNLRGLDLSIEQAAKFPRSLGQTTLLPLAVACEYLHEGCGLPAIFAFDLFQACLASCQNKALEVALYADKSKSFTCKARWWACPTGDPNAGKSPTCAFVMKAFASMVESLPHAFWPDQHWIGVGLRALDGTLLLYGPESKPILDPNFPSKKTVDTGKFLDLTRWLESANGGRFEWGTGAEENLRQKRNPPIALAGHEAAPAPLVFDPTNINLCLFQQFNLFEDWWCHVEALHKCGFSARVLMSPTGRAIVDREVGLQDPACVADLMVKIWAHTVEHHGPDALPLQPLHPSLPAQEAVRSLYYDLYEEDQKGGWGSAMKAALGKMEYHVPTAACLTALASWAVEPSSQSFVLSDLALWKNFLCV